LNFLDTLGQNLNIFILLV